MLKRIEECFTVAKANKRAVLIPFIMGYDGGKTASAELLAALPSAGADIIEIGIPFSDPMADGPTIQIAGKRALQAGASVANILEMVRDFRKQNKTTPIILMGYYNPIYIYGGEKFCRDATAAGVDGLILVDLPPEEEDELRPYLQQSGLQFIRLISPTSDQKRLPMLVKSASGFVYYISITGITGAGTANTEALKKQVDIVRKHTPLPVAVGFGIKTPEQAAGVAEFADAVVVGSALVDIFATKGKDAAISFVRLLAKALAR